MGRRRWSCHHPRIRISCRQPAPARGDDRRHGRADRVRLAEHDFSARAGGARRRTNDRSRRGRARRDRAARGRHAARHRTASGRQPGIRSRRQSVRHLQRDPGTGRAGVDLPRQPQRPPRVVRLGNRQPDVDDLRRGRTALRVEPVRRLGLSACFPNGTHEPYASDLGIACGLAFDRRGVLYVGDRSGTVFAVQPDRTVHAIATLPASVAAFHLAVGPDDCVYVSAPTLGPYDHVYRIDPATGAIDKMYSGFGRPQGIAFDSQGSLYVMEALAGSNGLYRVRTGRHRRTGGVGAVARRGRVQSERGAGRGVERHGLPARCADTTADL